MHVHAICWHAALSVRLLGREPLTPPPPGGLIWGEGRCVLLLVRNNQSQAITFTARRALIAVMHWALRWGRCSERSHTFSHHKSRFCETVEMEMCSFTTAQIELSAKVTLVCVCHPQRHKIKVNNNLFREPCAAPTPLPSCVPAHPSSPCSVWALEVVSRGLCPVHWSWKKSVSCLVMEQDVSASQEWWEVVWVSRVSRERDRLLEATSSEEVKAAFVSLLLAACLVIIPPPPWAQAGFSRRDPNSTGPRKSAQHTVNKD